jgi:hypothetical protein
VVGLHEDDCAAGAAVVVRELDAVDGDFGDAREGGEGFCYFLEGAKERR